MKFLIAFLALALFLLPSSAAEPEEHPAAINAHFSWCGEGKTAAVKLKRYEGFWEERFPKDGEYDDQPHITYVRKCAYRLAELYAQTGQKEKCVKKLKWVEKTDDSLPENAKEAPPEK